MIDHVPDVAISNPTTFAPHVRRFQRLMGLVGDAATRTLNRPATMLKAKRVHCSHDIRETCFPETGH